jgi:hypothetical protein
MNTHIARASLGVIAAAVVSLVLLGGSASASLPGPGPGGSETLNCSYAGNTSLAPGDAYGLMKPCFSNLVGYSASVTTSNPCVTTYYEVWIYVNGAGSAWFHDPHECGNGSLYYSGYYTPGNASQGIQMQIYNGAAYCNSGCLSSGSSPVSWHLYGYKK